MFVCTMWATVNISDAIPGHGFLLGNIRGTILNYPLARPSWSLGKRNVDASSCNSCRIQGDANTDLNIL